MIVTPDYGLSDIWHFNYPLKNLLSESLKSGKLPLWTDLVGNGFPVAAEGQIGAFSPLNWLIFGIFPMPLAFTAALFLVFVIASFGSYLLMRKIGLSKALSAVAALFASFNGYFVVQMTHLNLLQSFSFIPWALLFAEKFITEKSQRAVFWLGFTLAQMILVGYPQTFINTLIILSIYLLIRNWKYWLVNLFKLALAAVIAVFLSAVQLIPLLELVKESATISAAAGQRYIHPLPFKHLLTVINPFLFGDPSRGTYPVYGENWGMFWENMFYVGIIPILAVFLFFATVLLLFCHSGRGLARSGIYTNNLSGPRIKSGITGGILAVLAVSLLLSLGKYTPLSFLFKLPPLAFTRISSRFLAFSNISLGLAAVFALSAVLKNKKYAGTILVLVGALHLGQMALVFWPYHLVVDGKLWLKPPKTAGLIPAGARIASFGQSERWNRIFLTDGWRGKEEEYFKNRNSLDPNSNMIFGVRQLGIYAQQLPKRQEMIQRNMYRDDILGRNIRDVFGVTHIIDAKNEFEIIENKAALPDVRVGKNIIKVRDTGEALGRMAQPNFQSGEVLWEHERLPSGNEEVVVVNRSYYPGWMALLSGKKIPIYPVNINQQAVIVPKDTVISNLAFRYDPWSYKVGGIISVASLAAWLVLLRRFSVQ